MVARNTFLNLIGLGTPLVVALFAIPILIDGLGVQRFGVLALVWMLVGYFSVFDFGLGRALTQHLSARRALDSRADIPTLVWSTGVLLLGMGLVGAIALVIAAPFLVQSVIAVPQALQDEVKLVLYVLAFGVPISIATVGLRGVLEAYQRFWATNAIRIVMGAFSFLGPAIVLTASDSLVMIAAILVLARYVSFAWHFYLTYRHVASEKPKPAIRIEAVKPLLVTGGWMSVSNIINPLMGYLDRFVIGSLISLEAVAYYATPNEVVTKLWLIPAALTGALFPEFAYRAVADRASIAALFKRSSKLLFLVLYPVTLALNLFAPEFLDAWLGKALPSDSFRVLQWLSFGILINCLAHIPFSMIQAIGRADLLAKLYIAELPLFAIALWLVASREGIVGVAMIWALRMVIDSAILFWMANRLFTVWQRPESSSAALAAAVVASFAVTGVMPLELSAKVAIYLAAMLAAAVIFWRFALTADDRQYVRHTLKLVAPARPAVLHPRRAQSVRQGAPILVTGMHRSGTTWLGASLALAPGTILLNEPFNPARGSYALGGLAKTWYCSADGLDQEDAREAVDTLLRLDDQRLFTGDQLAKYLPFMRRGRIVMKDPIAALSSEWLIKNYGFQVVVSLKNPLSIAASIKRIGWTFDFSNLTSQPRLLQGPLLPYRNELNNPPTNEVAKSALLWKVIYACLLDVCSRNEGAILVKQEPLMREPVRQLRSVYETLGLEWSPAVEYQVRSLTSEDNPVLTDPRTPNVIRRNSLGLIDSWRKVLTPEEVALVMSTIGDDFHGEYPELRELTS